MLKMFRKPREMGLLKKGLVGLIAGAAGLIAGATGILSCDGGGNGGVPGPVYSDYEDLSGKTHYVIVTSDSLKNSFIPLRDWKTNKGVITKIFTEDVDINPGGTPYGGARDRQEGIRKFIKDQKLAHPELEYVLLGGDVEVVPHRQVYAECSLGAPFSPDDTIPCDLYYGDLDSTWDEDGDDVFGELSDNVDLHPDVFVGRAPVNNSAEVDNFVGKVLDYEQVHDMGNVKDVLFCAEKLSATCDAKVAKDWINPNVYDFGANGFTVTGLYESDGSEDITSVMSALESGPHIVNIYGHGSEVSLACGTGANQLDCDGLDANDVRTLTNSSSTSRNFIFYGLGCHSNHFDNTALFPSGDCILEELINDTDGGAVACIGTSRIGLYNAASANGSGPSMNYDIEFNRSLFSENINNLGKALADSKDYYAENSKSNQDYRWVQLCLNLLGDPEMMIWKDNLGTLTANTIPQTGYTEVNVDDGVNPVEGAKVCLNDGVNIYSALTDVNGIVLIPEIGSFTTTVTKKDYLPHVE